MNATNFKNIMLKFSASWCNPCNQASKYLKENVESTKYLEIDVSQEESLAKQYGVRNIPTFITLNQNGDTIDSFTGFNVPRIKQAIEKIS